MHVAVICLYHIADTMARRSFSAGSRDNGKDKDRDKDKDSFKDDSVIFFEPNEIIRSVGWSTHAVPLLVGWSTHAVRHCLTNIH